MNYLHRTALQKKRRNQQPVRTTTTVTHSAGIVKPIKYQFNILADKIYLYSRSKEDNSNNNKGI